MATKKEHVGAAKTIAVSLSGFSEPARKTASVCGIEVRQISEVTPYEILSWLHQSGIVTIETKSEVEYVRFAFPHEDFGIDPSVQELLGHDAVNAPVFFVPAEGKAITLARIMEQSRGHGPDFLADAPTKGTKDAREVVLTPHPGNFQVLTPRGYQDLAAVIIGLSVWAERRDVPIETGTVYSDDQGPLVRSLGVDIEVQGQPVTVSLHKEVAEGGIHVLL